MTPQQEKTFLRIITEKLPIFEFHHGDCIGADAAAHVLFRIRSKGQSKVILHPPTNRSKRAFCKADVELTPLPYLDRNKEIVINTDELIATPGEVEEQLRSGTWSTVRFARKLFRPIHIIFPNGKVKFESDPMFQ